MVEKKLFHGGKQLSFLMLNPTQEQSTKNYNVKVLFFARHGTIPLLYYL